MSNINNFNLFDFLSKPKNQDPDTDLSWEKMVSKWEEEVLTGLDKETFSFPLESDPAFANALESDTNGDQILIQLFNQDLGKSNAKSQFINESNAYFLAKSEKVRTGASRYQFCIERKADTIGKLSLRLKLKPWVGADQIPRLLNLMKDVSIKIEMGGAPIFVVPKLMLVYLICEKLGSGIKFFDVARFLETTEVEDIKKKIINWHNDTGTNFSNRYYFTDPADKCLDIPLLNDFFSYKLPIPLIALGFHDVRVWVDIPGKILGEFVNWVDFIGIISDDITYFTSDNRRTIASNAYELLIMNSDINYFHSCTNQVIKIRPNTYLKFLFIFIRPTDEFLSDENVCITDLPELLSVDIKLSTSSYAIDMGKVYTAIYDNIICYGIAVDGYSDMTNWIQVTNECIGLPDMLKFNSTGTNKFDNFNTSSLEQVYKIVQNAEEITIKLTPYSIPVSIEIYEITQNQQRVMSGMTGLRLYS